MFYTSQGNGYLNKDFQKYAVLFHFRDSVCLKAILGFKSS